MDSIHTTRTLVVCLIMLHVIAKVYGEKQHGDIPETVLYIHDGEEIRPSINTHRHVYNKDENTLWVLQEEMGVWALVFHVMSIEDSPKCRHDYLEIREIYDGVNKSRYSSLPSERYCGSDVPRPYLSQRPHVEIRFITDSLWEMEGFHIKAIHGLTTDILREKLNKYTGGQPRNMFMSPGEKDSSNTKSKQEGVIFYILIAASAAALLIFGSLLIYFIITMRKMGTNSERAQDSQLTSNQSNLTNGNHVTYKRQRQKTCKIDVENSGKRYTRGKLANISSTHTCTTLNEHSTDTLSHHNNLYVSNFQFNAN